MQIIGRRLFVFHARRPYALNAFTTYSYSINDYLLIIMIILNTDMRSRVLRTLENKKQKKPNSTLVRASTSKINEPATSSDSADK